jgi:chitodextrinase
MLAAPRRRRLVVSAAAAAIAIPSLLVSPAAAALESSQRTARVPSNIWAIKFNAAAARAFRASDFERLRDGGVNAAVVGRHLRPRMAIALAKRASRAGLLVLAERRRAKRSRASRRCASLRRVAPRAVCARLASSRSHALALARRVPRKQVIVVHLKRPSQIRRLRSARRGSILAVAPSRRVRLGPRSWAAPIRRAKVHRSLHLGVLARSRTDATLKKYLNTLGPRQHSIPPTSDTQAPSVPQGLTMTGATRTSITLAWEASKDHVGVAGYRLYRGGAVAGTTATTTYTYEDLGCGTTYTLALEAFNTTGNVSNRAEATTSRSTDACAEPTDDIQAPSVPQGLTMTGATRTSITLAWEASTDDFGVTGYRLYRGGVAAGTTPTTTYTFNNLGCGTTYEFALEAFDAAGNVSNRAEAMIVRSTDTCAMPPPPPDGMADLYVAASGSDANPCTQAAPCASFNRAYRVAQPGQIVEVAGGTYSAQAILYDPSKTSPVPVVIRPAASATVVLRGLKLGTHVMSGDGARNLTIKDMRIRTEDGRKTNAVAFAGSNNVRWENFDASNFYLNGVKNFTVQGGNWGPCISSDNQPADRCSNSKVDGNSYPYGNENVVIDGAYFHDYRIVLGSGAHFECMFLNGGRNIVVRNSTFTNCAFYDIFVARRSGDPFDGLTIENNWFDTPWNEATSGPRQVRDGAVAFSHGGSRNYPWKNVVVRFNSFHSTTGISWNEDGGSYTTSNNRAVGNILENQSCDTSRWNYAYNLMYGIKCGATDASIGPSFPYVSDGHLPAGDWHLSGGVAVDFVPVGQAGSSLDHDIDGDPRPIGAARDAGADEAQ